MDPRFRIYSRKATGRRPNFEVTVEPSVAGTPASAHTRLWFLREAKDLLPAVADSQFTDPVAWDATARRLASDGADWVLDLGPEGGVKGGEIVAQGTPEAVAATARSYTGGYLKPLLAKKAEAVERVAAE